VQSIVLLCLCLYDYVLVFIMRCLLANLFALVITYNTAYCLLHIAPPRHDTLRCAAAVVLRVLLLLCTADYLLFTAKWLLLIIICFTTYRWS
jgi:hypothetical protein